MSYQFKPCVNRTACTEDGTHCRSCGRSHEEKNQIRQITTDLSSFIQKMHYQNPNEFLEYVQRKVMKKLNRK